MDVWPPSMQRKLCFLHAEKTDQIKRPKETCPAKGQPPRILHLSLSPKAVPFRCCWACGCPQLPASLKDSYVSSPRVFLSLYLCAGHWYYNNQKQEVCHAFRLQCQRMMALSTADTMIHQTLQCCLECCLCSKKLRKTFRWSSNQYKKIQDRYLKTVIFYGSSRDSWQFVTSLATASLRKLGSGLAAQDSKETCLITSLPRWVWRVL